MIIKISKVAVASLITTTLLSAASLEETVSRTLQNNPEIQSYSHNNEGFKKSVEESEGAYLPKVDLRVTGEKRKTKTDNSTTTNTIDQNGYNAQLVVEQLLYDGGLTSSKIDEAQFSEKSNNFLNKTKVDKLLLDSINAYLDLVKYDLRLKLAKENVEKHKEYLKTAKISEDLTGNALDTYEVTAKLHLANIQKLDEMKNNIIAQNSFYRITKTKADNAVKLPVINKSLVGDSLEDLIESAKANNYSVLEQTANVKQQEAIVNKTNSQNGISLKLNLSAGYDDDLITNDVKQNTYSAKLLFTYNLYNGGSDRAAYLKEKLFLKEKQNTLEAKIDTVVESMSSEFSSYKISLSKIEELKNSVRTTEKIVEAYKLQFQGGTKTFVDLLGVERDLYDAKKNLINEKVTLVKSYYKILSLKAEMKNTIQSVN